MPEQSSITLFSSESTIRYIKDILTVLALPRGAEYQFRYETKYVENVVRSNIFSSTSCAGTKALVAFRSKNTETLEKRFIIPIRWVEIINISVVADFYTVRFKVKCYPSFSSDFKARCHTFQQINSLAKDIFKDGFTNDLAVLGNVLSIVGDYCDDEKRDNEYWQGIVSTLTNIPQYEDFYFLRCSSFFFANNSPCILKDNVTTLEEEKSAYLKIDYYQRKYNEADDSKIEVILDNNIISQSFGLRTKMEARYDSIRLGFQPKNTMNGTLSEIVICASNTSRKVHTEISLPIKVVKRKYSRILKALIMSVGAFLVGLPGLLYNTVDIKWKMLIAITGVCVMGFNHFIVLKGK